MDQSAQNAQLIRDTRRCVQALLPHVPMPVVDFAIKELSLMATPFATISAPGGGMSGASQKKGTLGADRFALRHMESGDFGEFGLDVPRGKGAGKRKFNDPSKWSFSMATAGDGATEQRRSR
ncbi:hypothetical protein FOA52_011317 [Chlamydomonas sp. UWO 241]|nr:hypothetical protein FOA52_011317 [Chlamydomonas sp. UWO 241]